VKFLNISLAASSAPAYVRGAGLLIVSALAWLVWTLIPASFTNSAGHVMAVTETVRTAAAVSVFFFGLLLVRPLPIWLISLLPFGVLPAAGIAGAQDIVEALSSEYLFSLFCGLLLADTISYWKLDRRAALHFFSFVGCDKRTLLAVTLAVAGVGAMWTAASLESVLLLPVFLAFKNLAGEFYKRADGRAPKGLMKALALGIAFAITVGTLANIVGSPMHRALYAYSQTEYGSHIRLSVWFGISLLLFTVGLPLTYAVLRRLLNEKKRTTEETWAREELHRAFIAEKMEKLGPPSNKKLFLHGIIGATVVGWTLSFVLQFFLGPGDLTEAFSPARITIFTLLLILGVRISEGNLGRFMRSPSTLRQPWWVLVFFAGCFAMAAGLERSGAVTVAGVVIAELISSHTAGGALAAFSSVLAFGNFMPTSVIADIGQVFFSAMLMPLSTGEGQAEVTLTLLPAATFLLPLGAAHCMIMYSTGLFTFGEFFRYGLRIALVIVPLMALLPLATDAKRPLRQTATPAASDFSFPSVKEREEQVKERSADAWFDALPYRIRSEVRGEIASEK
jgi:sodium-dependent dicarboxylate transporter 2/3/5